MRQNAKVKIASSIWFGENRPSSDKSLFFRYNDIPFFSPEKRVATDAHLLFSKAAQGVPTMTIPNAILFFVKKNRAVLFFLCASFVCDAIATPKMGLGEKASSPSAAAPNSSTINVQQSGKWIIGIIDTPTVKLASQGNSVQQRIPDSAAPFLKTISFNIENGTSQNNVSIPIPEGKRLVIEYISARAQGPIGQKYIAQIQTNVSHTESPRGIYWMVFSFQGTFSTIDVFTASQLMQVYAEPGNPPLLFVATRTGINGTAFVEATISGYLENIR
jgi:hypothetical protein